MRKRRLLVALGVGSCAIPTAWFFLEDVGLVIDNWEILSSTALILSLMVTGWKMKRRLKRRMELGLGRRVDDGELVSITAWMRIPDAARLAGAEAERNEFVDQPILPSLNARLSPSSRVFRGSHWFVIGLATCYTFLGSLKWVERSLAPLVLRDRRRERKVRTPQGNGLANGQAG